MSKTDTNPIHIAKHAAGYAAAQLIEDGMSVGLGTGSTTAFFIEALGKRCQEGLRISAAATSEETMRRAKLAGIPLVDSDTVEALDITVDGADEIDPHKNMIKGGGGALLREKLLAHASREMVVIVDETKLVDQLGTHPLPLEISPFVYRTTILRLKKNGYLGKLRMTNESNPFVTDNGNYIFDIQYTQPIGDPQTEHQKIKQILGILETGLFYQVAGRVIIGCKDGTTKMKR